MPGECYHIFPRPDFFLRLESVRGAFTFRAFPCSMIRAGFWRSPAYQGFENSVVLKREQPAQVSSSVSSGSDAPALPVASGNSSSSNRKGG